MNRSQYALKFPDYFSNVRMEVVGTLPMGLGRVLEVGCGAGSSLEWLKKERDCRWVAGVEIDHTAAAAARKKLDALYEGNVEDLNLPIEEGSLDAILFPDVLEHMIDPWALIKRLQALLKPGGQIIISIPNVRHFKVLWPLLVKGEWEYQEAGILDRTHLRFFTRKTALKLVDGFEIESVTATGLERGSKAAWLNLATFGLFRPFLEFQYIIVVRKTKDHEINNTPK